MGCEDSGSHRAGRLLLFLVRAFVITLCFLVLFAVLGPVGEVVRVVVLVLGEGWSGDVGVGVDGVGVAHLVPVVEVALVQVEADLVADVVRRTSLYAVRSGVLRRVTHEVGPFVVVGRTVCVHVYASQSVECRCRRG